MPGKGRRNHLYYFQSFEEYRMKANGILEQALEYKPLWRKDPGSPKDR
jgi:hypothetical protein